MNKADNLITISCFLLNNILVMRHMLLVKIKFRLKFFNLGWFSIILCSLALILALIIRQRKLRIYFLLYTHFNFISCLSGHALLMLCQNITAIQLGSWFNRHKMFSPRKHPCIHPPSQHTYIEGIRNSSGGSNADLKDSEIIGKGLCIFNTCIGYDLLCYNMKTKYS